MSRVTATELLGRRDLLVVCWYHIPELIGLLSPTAQWELHRFYVPSHDLSDEQFLVHKNRMLLIEPSLVQRVGKHYAQIFRTFKRYADLLGRTEWEQIRALVIRDYSSRNTVPATRSTVIFPLVSPEIDPTRMAKIVAEIVQRQGSNGD